MARAPCYCECCGRSFRANRYNRDVQKYCTIPACVQARRRKRQRQSYKKRYGGDAEFKASERKRCAAGVRKRRKAAEIKLPSAVGVEIVGDRTIMHALTGLVSHLTDESNPASVQRAINDYADRGRRLALPGIFGGLGGSG